MATFDQSIDPNGRSAGATPSYRAQLFGGSASGVTVELGELASRISVYRNGAAPFARPGGPGPTSGDVSLLGVYDLIEPVGPEMAIYVRAESGG